MTTQEHMKAVADAQQAAEDALDAEDIGPALTMLAVAEKRAVDAGVAYYCREPGQESNPRFVWRHLS